MKFSLGQIVATPGAIAAAAASGDSLFTCLARHQSGDWGEVDEHDRKENILSLEDGFRLMSVYTLGTGFSPRVTARPSAFSCPTNTSARVSIL